MNKSELEAQMREAHMLALYWHGMAVTGQSSSMDKLKERALTEEEILRGCQGVQWEPLSDEEKKAMALNIMMAHINRHRRLSELEPKEVQDLRLDLDIAKNDLAQAQRNSQENARVAAERSSTIAARNEEIRQLREQLQSMQRVTKESPHLDPQVIWDKIRDIPKVQGMSHLGGGSFRVLVGTHGDVNYSSLMRVLGDLRLQTGQDLEFTVFALQGRNPKGFGEYFHESPVGNGTLDYFGSK